MTRFGTKRIGALALAVAGVTAIAACSSSSSSGSATSSSTSGAVTQPGSVGSIPAAGTPSGTAGSITYGLTPGSVPNWILPIPTAAFNSVYNTFQFGWQMWRPIYFAPQGTTPTVDAQLSVANTPVWSNDDKTMSITLKPWKWSNGQTVSSKDLEFALDEIMAAVKVSPANWAAYTPGYFPDTLTSMSTPNASTLVVNMKSPVNPTWMEEDILGAVTLMPAAEWAKASASGPTLDFTNLANAKKIYNYLSRAVQVGEHLRDQPALADRVRTVQAERLQRHHRRLHHGAEHVLQRAARDPHVQLRRECRSPRTRPSSTPSRPGTLTSVSSRRKTRRSSRR